MAHATHDHPIDSYQLDEGLWTRVRNLLAIVAIVGLVGTVAGYAVDQNRFYESYLTAFTCWTSIALGAWFFVMIQYLTGSAWSVTVRRFMETMMVTLPLGAVLFIPVFLGVHHLYEWADNPTIRAEFVKNGKASYMSPNWFLIRAVIYFAIWSVWSYKIYSNSTEQDETKSIERMHSCSRWSAPGLLVSMLSVTLASFDWLVSLDPHWYSTIFGIYIFSGGAWAFFAVLTLLCQAFRNAGVLRNSINIEHYHDLGKWQFALTVFWTYIAFSQYLLIWYANIPEETIFFKHRFHGSWWWVSLLILLGHFVIPFLVLLSRGAKRNLTILKVAAIWVLFMHYVDHYWLVMPNFNREGIMPHWIDLATFVFVGSAYGLTFWTLLKRHSLVPVGDPRFKQSLEFHNV
jgi:hypothetical protein